MNKIYTTDSVPETLLYLKPIIEIASKHKLNTMPMVHYMIAAFSESDLHTLGAALYNQGYEGNLVIVKQIQLSNSSNIMYTGYHPYIQLNKDDVRKFYEKNGWLEYLEPPKPKLSLVEDKDE